MTYVVLKFGGTSVGTLERLQNAARIVQCEVSAGHSVVVVVSAMAGVTNQLVGYVRDLSPLFDQTEYDAVVSSGEQVTSGLLALALHAIGIQARSFQGWQIPILTDSNHGDAQIKTIDTTKLLSSLQSGKVAVVSGFQGVDTLGRITTLGRGGSDTTAVALAAAIGAKRCDIYTDVEGVFTADPRFVSGAKKIHRISYDEMLELAAQGAKVLHPRSVSYAKAHHVPLQVLSSLHPQQGTFIVAPTDKTLFPQRQMVRGLAHSDGQTMVILEDCDNKDLQCLGAPWVDMVLFSNDAQTNKSTVSLAIETVHKERMAHFLNEKRDILCYKHITMVDKMTKISIIGQGLRHDNSCFGIAMHVLKSFNLLPLMMKTADFNLSFLIPSAQNKAILLALHQAFELDK